MPEFPPDLETRVAYLRGDLDADTSARIDRLVLEDSAFREELLILASEEAALTDWAGVETVATELDAHTGNPRTPLHPDARGRLSTRRPNRWVFVATAAALTAAFLGSLAYLRKNTGGEIAEYQNVARLAASVDALWDGSPPRPNTFLPSGKYRLESGSIDLEFAGGARVNLSGPAAFELIDTRHLHLTGGQLLAKIPDEALGFVITSPESEVVDLGTEFGVSVSPTGGTDVHVLSGLVEVLPYGKRPLGATVQIAEGQARRFTQSTGDTPLQIPPPPREGRESTGAVSQIKILQGSVRFSRSLALSDFTKIPTGQNWIDLIPEQQAVTLAQPVEVTAASPGSTRDFELSETEIPAGEIVNSYLLHFRPSSFEPVYGVIRFPQPIAGVICSGELLGETDAVLGSASVEYPMKRRSFRGLEPAGGATSKGSHRPDWEPDEIVLSQDRRTLAIRAMANVEQGVDQIRILTRTQ